MNKHSIVCNVNEIVISTMKKRTWQEKGSECVGWGGTSTALSKVSEKVSFWGRRVPRRLGRWLSIPLPTGLKWGERSIYAFLSCYSWYPRVQVMSDLVERPGASQFLLMVC